MVPISTIQAVVCTHFKIAPISMTSQARPRKWCRPRQIAMYVARESYGYTLPRIGRSFGRRDHTTVMHACRVITEGRVFDRGLDSDIAAIEAALVLTPGAA